MDRIKQIACGVEVYGQLDGSQWQLTIWQSFYLE